MKNFLILFYSLLMTYTSYAQTFGVRLDFEPIDFAMKKGVHLLDDGQLDFYNVFVDRKSSLQGNVLIYYKRPSASLFGLGIGFLQEESSVQIFSRSDEPFLSDLYSNRFKIKQLGVNLMYGYKYRKFEFDVILGAYKDVFFSAVNSRNHSFYSSSGWSYNVRYPTSTKSFDTSFGALSVRYQITDRFKVGVNIKRRWWLLYNPLTRPDSYMYIDLFARDQTQDGSPRVEAGKYAITPSPLFTTISLTYDIDLYKIKKTP